MKYSYTDIQLFIANATGVEVREIMPDSDINRDLGCCGDDFEELISAYSKNFQVDISNYLWYFHTEDEASVSIFSMFSEAPYNLVLHIPVTPQVLLQSANAGQWLITYPEHTLPKYRKDLWINTIIVSLAVIYFIYLLIC